MQPTVSRAAAFAAVGTLALASPAAGAIAAVPFALIAVAGRLVSGGVLFDLFASPADRHEGQLRDLVSFALAATGLALLASLTGLPATVFAAAVLLLVYGDLAASLAGGARSGPLRSVATFGVGGATAAIVGLLAVAVASPVAVHAATVAFLAVTGSLLAALLRELLVDPRDPVVLVGVAGLLWVLASLSPTVEPAGFVLALAVAGGFGYLSWVLGTASLTGMLTGVVMSLATIVLGGLGWFAILIAFFGVGGLAAKYEYETKLEYGVAEANQGARTIRNVLGNAGVAVVAVLGFAASPDLGVEPALFVYLFCGSMSTAMADTLSSELGVLYGRPRLITTLESVETGTDGGVSLEGVVAGVGGAALVGAMAYGLLGSITPVGAAVIVGVGLAGMFADSLLGATLEGWVIGNQSVNFLATLVGGLLAPAAAIGVGAVPL